MKNKPVTHWLRLGLGALAVTGALLMPVLLTGPVQAQTSDATGFFEGIDFSNAAGPQIYTTICQGCHMSKGEGAAGGADYPALSNNAKLAAGPYVAMMVLDGNGAMPGFRDMLTDKQVVEIADYIRTRFGNNFNDPVNIDEVKAMRAANVTSTEVGG